MSWSVPDYLNQPAHSIRALLEFQRLRSAVVASWPYIMCCWVAAVRARVAKLWAGTASCFAAHLMRYAWGRAAQGRAAAVGALCGGRAAGAAALRRRAAARAQLRLARHDQGPARARRRGGPVGAAGERRVRGASMPEPCLLMSSCWSLARRRGGPVGAAGERRVRGTSFHCVPGRLLHGGGSVKRCSISLL